MVSRTHQHQRKHRAQWCLQAYRHSLVRLCGVPHIVDQIWVLMWYPTRVLVWYPSWVRLWYTACAPSSCTQWGLCNAVPATPHAVLALLCGIQTVPAFPNWCPCGAPSGGLVVPRGGRSSWWWARDEVPWSEHLSWYAGAAPVFNPSHATAGHPAPSSKADASPVGRSGAGHKLLIMPSKGWAF